MPTLRPWCSRPFAILRKRLLYSRFFLYIEGKVHIRKACLYSRKVSFYIYRRESIYMKAFPSATCSRACPSTCSSERLLVRLAARPPISKNFSLYIPICFIWHIRQVWHISSVGFCTCVRTPICTCMILSYLYCFTWNIYIVPYNCIYNCIWFWFKIFLCWFFWDVSIYSYNCIMLFIVIFCIFRC